MGDSSNYWKDVFSRRLSRRGFLRAGALGGASLAWMYALGCQPGQPRSEPSPGAKREPKPGGILRIGRVQDPPHLDPTLSTSPEAAVIHGHTYSRLIRPDSGPGRRFGSTKFVSDLAEVWELADEITYVFYLRKGVKFHDKPPVNGRELTAEDVKYTFERLLDKTTDSPNAKLYSLLDKIELPDRYTVKMRIKEPYAPFLHYLSHHNSSWIIPREAVEKFGSLKQTVIGTGPFILDSWERNVRAVFKRNPDYFLRGLPFLDGFEFIYVPDHSARMAAFQSGELDIGSPLLSEIKSVKSAIPGVRIDKELPSLQASLILQAQKPPYTSKRVRQAVKYALDLQALIDAVYSGEAIWGSPVPPAFDSWSLPQGEIKQLWRPDVYLAKQLLAESGLADGFKATLYTTPAYGQAYVDMAEIIARQLRAINVDVSLQSKEYAAHLAALKAGTFEMFVGPKTISTDIDEYLFAGYHTKGARNWPRGSEPALDVLLEKQRKSFKEEERVKIVRDIQRMLASLAFDIPMPAPYSFTAVPPYLNDYQGSADAGTPALMYVWRDK
ncbi:MAG: ABC transporter substrate-binding protein [Chloroflexi bacterium]|nr:ABC transporter substrate-binding protein [Chloroflexota bacterium]